MKTRPCKQCLADEIRAEEFGTYPAMKGKQSCVWHWLMKQSADVQRSYAMKREADAISAAGGGEHFVRRSRVPEKEWPGGDRWCAGCQSFVPFFYTTGSRCKSCASTAARASYVEKTYGITPEREAELLRQQGGRCAICRCLPRSQRLAVDHDHKTGAPRGLLCKRCNHDLLGGGHDDPLLLWAALAYLLFPPASYPDRSRVPHTAVWEAMRGRLAQEYTKSVQSRDSGVPAPF